MEICSVRSTDAESARSRQRRATRLAPSPTGGLHLGNARTFLVTWTLARQRGWRIAFRIDDLDSPRTKPGADRAAIEDLRWLGLDWDTEIDYQSGRLADYEAALIRLAAAGLIYPCRCTRTQIAARIASAPNEGDHELCYGGFCRPAARQPIDFVSLKSSGVAWRFWTPNETVEFDDQIFGRQRVSVAEEVGDFLVANKQGCASYQLAVNLDDEAAGITDVVRGDDLLSSTARQWLLRRALGLPCELTYWHLPLVVGTDGMRLAKRHGATRISELRDAGVPAVRIIGAIAAWCGLDDGKPRSAAKFAEDFDIEKLPRQRVVLTGEMLDAIYRGS